MKSGAIFDMDGLLFDTEKIYQKYWLEVAGEFGGERNPEFGRACCGTSGERTLAVIKHYYPNADAKAFLSRVMECVAADMEKELSVMPGVREILDFFQKRVIPMAVASSTRTSLVKRNLTHAGLIDYFRAVIGGDQITKGKPAPDIFLLAAEKINLPAEDCYVFEDGFNGIRAAAAAGCTAVMIPDLLEPDEEIRSLCSAIYPSLTAAMDAIHRGEL